MAFTCICGKRTSTVENELRLCADCRNIGNVNVADLIAAVRRVCAEKMVQHRLAGPPPADNPLAPPAHADDCPGCALREAFKPFDEHERS